MCGRWSWVAMRSRSQRNRCGPKGTVIIHIVDWIDNIIFVSWDDDDLHHQTIMIACTHQINPPTACNLSLFRHTPVLTSIIGLTTIATISNFPLIQIKLPCGSLTHTHRYPTSLSLRHTICLKSMICLMSIDAIVKFRSTSVTVHSHTRALLLSL